MGENNELRLSRIEIKGLFRKFDIDINLENGENVAILTAPNGCGKTTIFNLVTCIFAPTPDLIIKISGIPLDSVKCTLSNDKKIVFKCTHKFEKSKWEASLCDFSYRLYLEDAPQKGIKLEFPEDRRENYLFERKLRENSEVYGEYIYEAYDNSRYRRRGDEVLYRQYSRFASEICAFIKKNRCDIMVNFISADRLHNNDLVIYEGSLRHYREMEQRSQSPLEEAQKSAKELFSQIRDAHNKLQTEVKDKLPKEYLNMNGPLWDYEGFKQKWDEYVFDIEKYFEIGLLDSSETILDASDLKELYEKNGTFLSAYLAAFSKALEPIAKEYDRMKLFIDILNERNKGTGKKFKYSKEGIVVSVDNRPIPLSCLSSGEKNDFIMFFDLIFKTPQDSIVLIDEPEISLHIEWQDAYMDSLMEICELNHLQAVVATHSPNIINGHFELLLDEGWMTNGC